jgi:hypothetical protein
MTSESAAALATELTDRFAALDGVRGIFPEHVTALALVTGGSRRNGLVRVDTGGPEVVVSARLATSRSVPAASIVADARRAVVEVLGTRPYALDIEVAYID